MKRYIQRHYRSKHNSKKCSSNPQEDKKTETKEQET